jgi:hypothetical protein
VTDNRDNIIESLEPAPVAVPIEAKGTITKSQLIFVFAQIIAALGGVIAFMGLGDQVWIVKLYRFLQSAPAVPILGMLAWAGAGIALWFRNKRRAIERAVMAALVSNRVGKIVGPVSPAVQAAIDQAVKAQYPMGQFSPKTKGL